MPSETTRDVRTIAARLLLLAGVLLIVAAAVGITLFALRDEKTPEEQIAQTVDRYNTAVDELDWRTLYDQLTEASQERIGRDCLRIIVQRSGSGLTLALISKLPQFQDVEVRGNVALARVTPSDTRQFVRERGAWRVDVEWSGIARLAGLTPPNCEG